MRLAASEFCVSPSSKRALSCDGRCAHSVQNAPTVVPHVCDQEAINNRRKIHDVSAAFASYRKIGQMVNQHGLNMALPYVGFECWVSACLVSVTGLRLFCLQRIELQTYSVQ